MNHVATDHERIAEIVAAYALGSLSPGDEASRELLEHVPGCASCGALFRDLREVAADLALTAPAHPVPKDLEARIVARVRGEVQAVKPASAPRTVSMRVAGVAAVLVLLVGGGLGAWNVSLSGRVDRAERRSAVLAQALGILGDPAAIVTPLSGRLGGTMALAFRPGGKAVIVGTRLPDPGAGKVFEVWFLRNGIPVPVGVFRPDGGIALHELDSDPIGSQQVAVTVEAGRVAAPTSTPVYAAALTIEERLHADR